MILSHLSIRRPRPAPTRWIPIIWDAAEDRCPRRPPPGQVPRCEEQERGTEGMRLSITGSNSRFGWAHRVQIIEANGDSAKGVEAARKTGCYNRPREGVLIRR